MQTIATFLLAAISALAVAQPIHTGKSGAFNQTVSTSQLTLAQMTTQPTQIVNNFLTAIRQGDHATLAASLSDGVVWHQPGTNFLSGVKRYKAEVFQMVGGMVELTGHTLKLTDVKVLAENGNEVACLLHWKAARPTGEILDVDNIDVYTVENGQIVKARIFSADLTQEDKFWVR